MRDLREFTGHLERVTSRLEPIEPGARAVMFVSVHEGEGTTSFATSTALSLADKAQKAPWLVDLDLEGNSVIAAFEKSLERGGRGPGRAFDASLRQPPIYTLTPKSDDRGKLFTAHEIEGTNMLVTRFRTERLAAGQRVSLVSEPNWWQTLRGITDYVIVDAPALDVSDAAHTVADQVDGIFLVVRADHTAQDEIMDACESLEASGGLVLGVAMNHVGSDAQIANRLFS
ncbi:MAG: hypothetical protein QNI84_10320 [Henriciella sp.]|nr:hypothetical protein [Henriciella sp.]